MPCFPSFFRPFSPAKAVCRLFTAFLFGTAALLAGGCATTQTEETAQPVQRHFFSPHDGKYFAPAIPPSEETVNRIMTLAENGDSAALYEFAFFLLDKPAGKEHEKRAFELMKQAAKDGLPDAEVYLGTMYRIGQGTEKNRDEAIRWYNAAIAKGSAWGMFEMGSLLFERPQRDVSRALQWFRKAAEAGYPTAQTAYGVFLLEGKSLPKDAVKGEMYIKKAVESGDAFSRFSLAIMYLRGMHFEKNPEMAEMWMKKAAESHYPPAIDALPWISRMREKECKAP